MCQLRQPASQLLDGLIERSCHRSQLVAAVIDNRRPQIARGVPLRDRSDSLHAPASSTDPQPAIMQTYAALSSLEDMLATAQSAGRTRGVVLHANSPRAVQSVSLGGYLFEASLSRAWKTGTLLADDGGMLLLESRPDEFIVVGSGLTVANDDQHRGLVRFVSARGCDRTGRTGRRRRALRA